MELEFDIEHNESRARMSTLTGSWVAQPRRVRIPQIDDDAVYVNASIDNPVDQIRSTLLPFQELC